MSIKIIMAVGATNLDPYPQLIKSCQNTWDSIKHPNFHPTVYFYGENFSKYQGLVRFADPTEHYVHYTNIEETVSNEAFKFIQMMKDIMHLDWDYLVAGSTSSYWDKVLLYQKCYSLPRTRVYCGLDGGGYASGCGRIFSRDVVQLLIDGLPTDPCTDEDALIGTFLRNNHNINVNGNPTRVQYNYDTHKIERNYHYRVKELRNNKLREIEAFTNIFNGTCF